jgi:hypothetical protein
MRPGASLFVVGYGGTLNVPTMKIILEELNFIGNLVGTYIDLVELMVLAAQGKVHLRTKECDWPEHGPSWSRSCLRPKERDCFATLLRTSPAIWIEPTASRA